MPTKLAALGLLSAFASCGTIIDPSPETVAIRSNPIGASVYQDGELIGTTPCSAPVDRDQPAYDFRLELAGHKTVHRRLDAELNPWIFGNLILFGLIPGVIVDSMTGGARAYTSEFEVIQMEPGEGEVEWRSTRQKRRDAERRAASPKVETYFMPDGTRRVVRVDEPES